MSRSELAVVIVSWNSRELLRRCLASLPATRYEVVVVDNASADGSAEMVEAEFPWVRLVRHQVNRGFAAGVNAGAAATNAPLLLLLNSDIEVRPGSIEALLAAAGQHPGAGALGGRLIGSDGSMQADFNVRRFPTLATWAVDLLLVDKLWPRNPVTRQYLAADLPLDHVAPVDQPAAACLLLRREAFDRLGGFDESFFPAWFEDVDFCRRLKAAGWDIRFVPDARFHHLGGVAMRRLGLRAFSRAWYRNLERYAAKHYSPAAFLALKGLIVAGMLLRSVISVVTLRLNALPAYLSVLAGTLTGWRDAPPPRPERAD